MFSKVDKTIEDKITLPVNYDNLNQRLRRVIRLQYIEEQNNLCYYCKKPLSNGPSKEVGDKKITESLFPPAFFMHPVHLHHSHDTGMTIGAVHAYCNAVLWEYEGE